MAKLVRPYLEDIIQQIEDIEAGIAGKSMEDYAADRTLQKVVERSVEIISEAARHIPPELQATQPQVPWPQITSVGNILRHEYRNILNQVMYLTVVDDIPILKAAIVAIEAALDEPRE